MTQQQSQMPDRVARRKIAASFVRHVLQWNRLSLRDGMPHREEVAERIKEDFKALGIDGTVSEQFKEVLIEMVQVKEDAVFFTRANQVFLAGLGAVNLVVLATIFTIGHFDLSLYLSLSCMCLSIPTTVGYLCIRYIQQHFDITTYEWPIINMLASIAVVTSFLSLTALLWHASLLIALLFVVTFWLVALLCGAYYLFAGTRHSFINKRVRQQKHDQVAAPQQSSPDQSLHSTGVDHV